MHVQQATYANELHVNVQHLQLRDSIFAEIKFIAARNIIGTEG